MLRKPLRWATDEDVKMIVRRYDSDFEIEKNVGYLGLKLSKAKLEIVTKKLRKKAKRIKRKKEIEVEEEKQALKDAFRAAIREIVPACRGVNCGNQAIQAKTSSHYHAPQGLPGTGPDRLQGYLSRSIDLLYCPHCGLTYYNDQVEVLSRRYAAGEFEPKPLLSGGHNTMFDDPFPQYR